MEKIEYVLKKGELTKTVTTKGDKIGGNLGRSFPINFALPFKHGKQTYTSIESINTRNYKTV